jgi:hypothetical protein
MCPKYIDNFELLTKFKEEYKTLKNYAKFNLFLITDKTDNKKSESIEDLNMINKLY